MAISKKFAMFCGVALVPFVVKADETSFYGYMSSSIESASATGASNGGAQKPGQMRVTDNNSRIGMRGKEDLGNGLKVIWQVESSLRNFEQGGTTDWGQTATLGTRNTYIGLDDANYGRFVVGYNDNAYKSLVGSTSDFGLDVMANTTADNWGTGPGSYSIFSRGESRMKNSLHYTTPSISGFQFAGSYGFDETSVGGVNKTRYGLAGKYVSGGFKLGVGWDHQSDVAGYVTSSSSLAHKSTNYYKLISSYLFASGTLLGAGVERGTFDAVSSSQMSQTGWTVAVSQPLGRWALKGSYSRLGGLSNASTGTPNDYKATQWVVGSSYALSKRTTLFAYYTRITNGDEQNVNFGFNQETTGTNAANTVVLANGNDLRALGIGMGISF